jgi:hypothetical protein
MSVTTDVRATSDFTSREWEEIWRLTRAFYDTDRDYAEERLRAHRRTALFRSTVDGALVGMASLDVYPVTFAGRRLAVIYTSHVLLQERYRGHDLVQRLGLRTFLHTRIRYPIRSIYWFFDTFSYKSYLLLPRNFRDFWPRHDRATPEWEHALMNHLAGETYGAAWDAQRGVVMRSGRKRLRPEVAPVDEKLAHAPDVAFFTRVNPEHAEGDMLVCLCPLSVRNWLSVGARSLERAVNRRSTPSRPSG